MPRRLVLDAWLPYRLTVLSNEVSLCLYRVYNARFQVSVAGWRIIAHLAAESPLASTEVAERAVMDPVQVSRAVSDLVRLRMVSRGIDRRDRRRLALRLTAKGRRVYRVVAPLGIRIEAALLSDLTATERRSFDSLLTRVQRRASRVLIRREDGSVVFDDAKLAR